MAVLLLFNTWKGPATGKPWLARLGFSLQYRTIDAGTGAIVGMLETLGTIAGAAVVLSQTLHVSPQSSLARSYLPRTSTRLKINIISNAADGRVDRVESVLRPPCGCWLLHRKNHLGELVIHLCIDRLWVWANLQENVRQTNRYVLLVP
jgi:hypothetical protein